MESKFDIFLSASCAEIILAETYHSWDLAMLQIGKYPGFAKKMHNFHPFVTLLTWLHSVLIKLGLVDKI